MTYTHQQHHRSTGSGGKSATKSDKDLLGDALAVLLREEDNKYCADCEAKSPRWASWNIGVFLCIRCAGIHRKLGVHISRVKSVNLDSWTVDQVASVAAVGNTLARAAYEANLPNGFRRPQGDAGMEQFIKAKYEDRRYLIADFKPPRPDPAAVYSLLKSPAVVQQQQQQQRQQQSTGLVLPRPPQPPQASTSLPKPKPQPQPQPPPPPPPQQQQQHVDLLMIGEEDITSKSPSSGGAATAASAVPASPDSDFGCFASPSGQQQQHQPRVNPDLIFDDGPAAAAWPSSGGSADAPPKKSAKDSIMALYGAAAQQSQQHLLPGSMHYSASSPALTAPGVFHPQHPAAVSYHQQQQQQQPQSQAAMMYQQHQHQQQPSYSSAAGTLIFSAGQQQQQQQQFYYQQQQQHHQAQQQQHYGGYSPYQQQSSSGPMPGTQQTAAYLQQVQSQMANMGFAGTVRPQQPQQPQKNANDLLADLWN